MAVGLHYTKNDWNAKAFALLQSYQAFCQQAQSLAADVAPYPAATLATMTGFTNQEATDLISGINVADAMRQHSLRNVGALPLNDAQAITASQGAVALGKFGGA